MPFPFLKRDALGAVLALALIPAACSTQDFLGAEAEYASNVRGIGLRPIYPPREDIQPGDVYLVSQSQNPADPEDRVRLFLGSDTRVLDAALAHLSTRHVQARTTAVPATAAVPNQPDLSKGQLPTRAAAETETLPAYAMPQIKMDRGLGVSVGAATVTQALGLGGSGRTSVTLDFHDVRVLRVPKLQGQTLSHLALQKVDPKPLGSPALTPEQQVVLQSEIAFLAQRRAESRRMRNKPPEQDLGKRCHLNLVVTGVYLTRRIDYIFDSAAIRGAALRLRDDNSPAATGAPSAVVLNVDTEKPLAAQDIAAATNALRAAQGAAAASSAFEFVSFDAFGLRFKRVFERPVAVGWEGVQSPIDTLCNSGE